MKTVLIVALLVCLVVALVMILVPGGPRVTQITRRRERQCQRDDDCSAHGGVSRYDGV